MPELPEVDTIRAGLDRWVRGRTIAAVQVCHPRAVRRHPGGGEDFARRLSGRTVSEVARRGKYLWLVLDGGEDCVVVHLGMSGQLLVQPDTAVDERHMHVRFSFTDGGGRQLRFVDQRTFGGMLLDRLIPALDRPEERVPSLVAHIARDPLDPAFDASAFVARLRRRGSAVKRALLDQTLISGVGNIYADEGLWRAGVHGERRADRLTRAQAEGLLAAVRDVLVEARRAGGTSFDALYVDVDGAHGYFARRLNVYGRADEPCSRCGTAIRRAAFMNRSSFFCPRCQPPPHARRPRGDSIPSRME